MKARAGIDPEGYKVVSTAQGPVYLGQSYGNQRVAWFQGGLAWSATSPMNSSRLFDWVRAYRLSSARSRENWTGKCLIGWSPGHPIELDRECPRPLS